MPASCNNIGHNGDKKPHCPLLPAISMQQGKRERKKCYFCCKKHATREERKEKCHFCCKKHATREKRKEKNVIFAARSMQQGKR